MQKKINYIIIVLYVKLLTIFPHQLSISIHFSFSTYSWKLKKFLVIIHTCVPTVHEATGFLNHYYIPLILQGNIESTNLEEQFISHKFRFLLRLGLWSISLLTSPTPHQANIPAKLCDILSVKIFWNISVEIKESLLDTGNTEEFVTRWNVFVESSENGP